MDLQSEAWQIWAPERMLRGFSPNEVRYSRGFLQVELEQLFPSLKAHWLPLFHALGGTIQFQLIEKGFEFPSGVRRQFVVEFDGEPALLALDSRAERSLAQAVVPDVQGSGAEVILNYLERRLLYSLTKSWSGEEPLVCYHTSVVAPETIEVVGVVHLQVLVDGVQCSIWFGLQGATVDRLDQIAKRGNPVSREGEQISQNRESIVSLELAELLVPTELIQDYLRPGTVIGLDLPVRADVIVRVNNVPWALGRLGVSRGRFGVQLIDFDPGEVEEASGSSKLRVQIGEISLSGKQLRETAYRGAILMTETPVSAEGRLLIGDESVGTAMVGEIAGQFALNVTDSTLREG